MNFGTFGVDKKDQKDFLRRYPIRTRVSNQGNLGIESESDAETPEASSKDSSQDSKSEPDVPKINQAGSGPESSATLAYKEECRQQDGPKAKTSQRANEGINIFYYLIAFLILLLSLMLLNYDFSNGSATAGKTDSSKTSAEEQRIKNEKFVKEMNSIITMLKNTESNLRYVNRSLSIFINNGQPEKPAIFLLLGTNSSACQLCICTWKFVEALREYYNQRLPQPSSGHITAEELAKKNDNDKKIYIEESVEKVVSSGEHLVLFEDIEKFSNASLIKMHAYLDHENAPHKNVVYILTSVADHEVELKTDKHKELNNIATKHFDDQWSDYDKEHRRALMGRMTSVIGLIHKGKLENEWIKHKDIDKFIKEKCHDKCKI